MFHGKRVPPISLPAYLERIAKYTKVSPACFVVAVIYMDAVCLVSTASTGARSCVGVCLFLGSGLPKTFHTCAHTRSHTHTLVSALG